MACDLNFAEVLLRNIDYLLDHFRKEFSTVILSGLIHTMLELSILDDVNFVQSSSDDLVYNDLFLGLFPFDLQHIAIHYRRRTCVKSPDSENATLGS